MKTGIIIPCYNEEKRLDQKAFVQFISENPTYHLCFVNDGSKDKTLDVLQTIRNQSPRGVSIVDVKKNVGKASAVRAGVRYLYNRKEIAHIGFIDADLSTDFKDFKDLVNTLKSDENLSVVFGSRNSGGKGIERDLFRNLMSKVVKAFILFIIGMPIRDTQCGAKVFSRSIVPVVYGKSFMSRWLFDVEIFLRLKNFLGKKCVMQHISERPLMRWVHVEDSKLGLKDSLVIPVKLFHIWLSYNVAPRINLIAPSPEFEPAVEFYTTPGLTIAA